MTEKVKLTREQAEAIEFALNTERLAYYKNPDALLGSHILSKNFNDELKELRRISNVDLAKALYIGYEVEPEYKVGDWVRQCVGDGFRVGQIERIYENGRFLVDFRAYEAPYEKYKESFSPDEIDYASSEEIKAEQERRVWAKIGREVGEFQEGDLADHNTGEFIKNTSWMKTCYEAGVLKGFYPAESFIEFGGDADA